MRRAVAALTLAAAVGLVPAGLARAAVLGPFCWTIPPFADVLSLSFITDDNGNTAAVVGRDVSIDAGISGAATLESDGVTANLVATIGQANVSTSTTFLQIRFNRGSLVGSGQCQVVNPASGGCRSGTNISFVPVTCPTGTAPASPPTGPRAGGGE